MKNTKWPTLKGRLEQSIKTELDALKQLSQLNELSVFAKKRMKKLKKDSSS